MYQDWIAGLRREIAEWTRFCGDLSDEEWLRPSGCEGWRVQDIVAHVGGTLHALFTPTGLKLMRSTDIERTNDEVVARRHDWPAEKVFGEYRRWTGRSASLASVLVRTRLAGVSLPLGDLGRFRLGLVFCGALLFDQHTHLRHDIAPALDRPVPATDEARMSAVLAWMLAVLSNQLRSADPSWLDRPLAIGLSGPGGGTWRVGEDGSVVPGEAADAVVRITAAGSEFPSWATCRTSWREHDVRIAGDQGYGAWFLDAVNIV